MKNLKPIYILLGGGALVTLFTLIGLFIINLISDINYTLMLLIPLLVGTISFFVFFFFIKHFITEKLKVLYRSIRKGKFEDNIDNTFSINDDVIEKAEIETKQWTEERIEEISKLKEQEEFRREFLGNLAHELKTPVFSIQGYILTLLEGGLEDENVNRMFLKKASKATDRMTKILEDLDHITKMEVNAIALDLTNFDIKELVSEIFEALEVKARNKNIDLKFSKNFDPVFVHADRGKIGQVLINLISNSIAYGNEGGETSVRFYIMNDIITIEVSDNGPGISEEHLPRLFERFYRVEKSRNRNEGGTGLGLPISKHIIESHEQTISVRSTVEVGSTFTFSLDKRKK